MIDKTIELQNSYELAANVAAAELAGLPPRERVQRARELEACRSRAFIQLAIGFCRRLAIEGDTEAVSWGRVAVAAAEKSPSPFGPELLPLAWAVVGNAYRALGNLRKAAWMFEMVRDLIDDVTDENDAAAISSLEASLWMDLGDLDRAEVILRSAIQAATGLVSPETLNPIQIKLGQVLADSGDQSGASEILAGAIQEMDESEPRMLLNAIHNLAFSLVESGRFESAMMLFHKIKYLYRDHASEKLSINRDWLKARIAVGMGSLEEGELRLRLAREQAERVEHPHLAGLIELDRAEVLLRMGNLAEVQYAATLAAGALEAAGSDREALAAVLLVSSGAARRQAEVQLLELLEKARHRASARPS
ncbi:MAG: hypothetical protein AAF604_04735 [Acidobacteriota bacterium]